MKFKLEEWLALHAKSVSKVGKNAALAEAIKNAGRDMAYGEIKVSEFETLVDELVGQL